MKSKIISALLFVITLFSLSSCRTYLTPAALGNNMGYLPKAMCADSIKSKISFSGSYAGASSPDGGVAFEMGMANISRSHTFKDFNLAYGVFGYAGNASNGVRNESLEDLDKYLPSFKKSINGAGLRLSIGAHSASSNGNTDFRYINFENSISFESGSYVNYRKEIYNGKIPNYVAVSNKDMLWTTGLSTEVIWRARRNHDIKHAFRLFIGGSPGLAKSFKYGSSVNIDNYNRNSVGWVFNYFLSVKRFSLGLETANNVNLAQKISLGYSL